ncbi:unnamed protein product, partial [Scytosiphon promiscuus]
PSPTADASREPCSSWCLDSARQPCFDDPTCPNGYVGTGSGIGCNATGDTYCRFCGFLPFVDCPPGTPTLAPSPAPTPEGPTIAPTVPPTTRAPTI